MTEQLRCSAEVILSRRFGVAVEIRHAAQLGDKRDHGVWRLDLCGGSRAVPSTAIVKASVGVGGFGGDRCAREHANLTFLQRVLPNAGIVPVPYGWARSPDLVVLEDFGRVRSLEDILVNGDARLASRALHAMATTLAELHVATRGRESTLASVHAEHGLCGDPHRHDLDELAAAFARKARAFDVAATKGLELDLGQLASFYRSRRHGAFSQGDGCACNWLQAGERIRLIDVEHGHFRDVMLDCAYWWLGFPCCWASAQVPARLHRSLSRAYVERWQELRGPSWSEDELDRHQTAAAAYFAVRSWVEDSPEHDIPLALASTRRRVEALSDGFLVRPSAKAEFPALHATLSALRQSLGRLQALSRPGFQMFPAFSGRPRRSAPASRPPPLETQTRHDQSGVYEINRMSSFRIRARSNALYLEPCYDRTRAFPLRQTALDVFAIEEAGFVIRFLRCERGRVIGAVVTRDGKVTLAPRIGRSYLAARTHAWRPHDTLPL